METTPCLLVALETAGLLLLQEQIKHFKRTGQRAAPNEKVD